MSLPADRGQRGASILASLVLMAMLGAAGAAEFLNVQPASQLADAPRYNEATYTIPVPPADPRKKEMAEKCTALKQQALAQKKSTTPQETGLPKGQDTVQKDNCTAALYTGEQDAICVGLTSKIYIQKDGTGKVVSKLSADVPAGTCKTQYCTPDDKKCLDTGAVSGIAGIKSAAANPDVFKTLPSDQQQSLMSSLGETERSVLNDALTAEAKKNLVDAATAAATAQSTAAKLDDIASSCAFGGDTSSPGCANAAANAAQAQADAAKAQAAAKEAQDRYDALAAAQSGPNANPMAGVDAAKYNCDKTGCYPARDANVDELTAKGFTCTASAGDPNQVCTPPAKAPAPDPTKTTTTPKPDPTKTTTTAQPDPTKRQQTTFQQDPQDNNNNNNQNKSGMPDIASMLKGLMGGSPGGSASPAAGNQTPQAPGTCPGGQLLCSNNTLYSRNNQCVDTPMQTCPTGCAPAGNACATAQQCPTAPAQPDPAGCANGTWKPTYNGACVGSWQCVPSGTGTGTNGSLTAQISCNPQVADVGMSIAIAYSCSAGTSTGTGFQTNGAQSGSALATTTNPAAGSNSASYGLTCNSAGTVATAQCSVQVGKPSIVLIANPKDVASGGQSALGWITSGMQSCVISSPDIPAFTTQNAGNTNVNGTATTPPLTKTATTSYAFVLHCVTVGGGTRDASTTVTVI